MNRFHSYRVKDNKGAGLLLIAISYTAFISLGLPDGLLGVSWPYISARHNIPLDSLGAILIVFVGGYLSTSTISGKILERISLGLLLALSCCVTGISLLTYAFTDHWIALLGATFFLGSGGGAIDSSINTFAASRFSPSVVNWLHAFYGVGATGGPFIITWMFLNDREWFHGYILVGVIQVLLSGIFLLTRKKWTTTFAGHERNYTESFSDTLKLPGFAAMVIVFFIYTGLEAGVGQWIFTILTQSRGLVQEQAGLHTSAYWGSLTTGRIIFGFILTRLSVEKVLIAGFSGIILGSVLLALNVNAIVSLTGIVFIGFFNAPIFPCLISLTPRRVGQAHAANMIGLQISAALVGSALLPGLAGIMTGYFDWEVIPVMFVIEAVLLLVFYLFSYKRKLV